MVPGPRVERDSTAFQTVATTALAHRGLLFQFDIPIDVSLVVRPFRPQHPDVQPEVEPRIELVGLNRLLPEREACLVRQLGRLPLVAVDARQRQVGPDRPASASPWQQVVDGVIRRLEQHATVLAGAVVTDRDVAARHRNLEPQLPADVVPQLDDARQSHLEGRRAEDPPGIFRDHDGAILPLQVDGALPGHESYREALSVENESIAHKPFPKMEGAGGVEPPSKV
jgi:hypothetical protein